MVLSAVMASNSVFLGLFGLGVPELVIILIVILLLLGPKLIPKLGRSFGKSVKGLREGLDEAKKAAGLDENEEGKKNAASSVPEQEIDAEVIESVEVAEESLASHEGVAQGQDIGSESSETMQVGGETSSVAEEGARKVKRVVVRRASEESSAADTESE